MSGVLENVTLELVPHAEAVDPGGWLRSHDDRPLSPRGWDQASRLAEELGSDVDAIYSSPALRCVQTVEPLSKASGRAIAVHEGLRETDPAGCGRRGTPAERDRPRWMVPTPVQ